MAEVWVVYWTEHDEWNIEGVWGSLEAADAYVRMRENVEEGLSGDGWGMWSVAGRPGWSWYADRFEVLDG